MVRRDEKRRRTKPVQLGGQGRELPRLGEVAVEEDHAADRRVPRDLAVLAARLETREVHHEGAETRGLLPAAGHRPATRVGPTGHRAARRCVTCSITSRATRSPGLLDRPAHAEVTEPGNLETRVAARVDAAKGREVDVDVDRDAVIGAAPAHPQPEGGELRAVHVDPGRPWAPGRDHPRASHRVDHRLLESVDEAAHPDSAPTKVDEDVDDRLAGSVVRHLPPAVRRGDRNPPRGMHVLAPPRLPEGVDRGMLDQPDLVRRVPGARVRERSHVRNRALPVPAPEPAKTDFGREGRSPHGVTDGRNSPAVSARAARTSRGRGDRASPAAPRPARPARVPRSSRLPG